MSTCTVCGKSLFPMRGDNDVLGLCVEHITYGNTGVEDGANSGREQRILIAAKPEFPKLKARAIERAHALGWVVLEGCDPVQVAGVDKVCIIGHVNNVQDVAETLGKELYLLAQG